MKYWRPWHVLEEVIKRSRFSTPVNNCQHFSVQPPSLSSFTTTPTDSVLIMESLYVPLFCLELIAMVKRTVIRRQKLMADKNLYPQTIVRVQIPFETSN